MNNWRMKAMLSNSSLGCFPQRLQTFIEVIQLKNLLTAVHDGIASVVSKV